MPHTIIASDRAPRAIGPYSQAVLVERAGGATLYCAGQIALDPATGNLVGGDVRVQAERVLANVEGVLAGAGMGFGDVVRTTVYLVDLADFAAMNEVYASRFQGAFPARSTVQVAALPRGARVEIEVLAEREGPAQGAQKVEPMLAARRVVRKAPRRPARRPARRGARRRP
jgi:2-iminobutanoate/2-iminopropanoate deaminase